MKTLNVQGVAEMFFCHPDTISAMAAAGEIPAAKVGRSWVFIEEDLLNWLRSRYERQQETVEKQPIKRSPFSSREDGIRQLEKMLGRPIKQRQPKQNG